MWEMRSYIDLGMVVILIWLAAEDLWKREVKGSLIGAGIIVSILGRTINYHDLIGTLGGVGVGISILLLGKLTNGSMGKGDGLVFVFLGIWLGFYQNVCVLAAATFFAGAVAALLLITGKMNRKGRLPFLPFVLIAYVGVIYL